MPPRGTRWYQPLCTALSVKSLFSESPTCGFHRSPAYAKGALSLGDALGSSVSATRIAAPAVQADRSLMEHPLG